MRPSLISYLGPAFLALAACNTAPTGPQISLGPDAPTTVDDLVATVTAEASDAQGEVDLVWTWSVREPGGPASFLPRTDQVGPVVPSSVTAKGQTWRVEVYATDGELDSEPSSAEITVLNTPPTVTQARLTPAGGVNTFGTLTATAAATDIDGDKVDVDITWYVDGVALDVDSRTLSGDYFTGGQEVWTEVVVSDGEVEADPVTSPKVVIDNLPPSLSGATISPEAPVESSVLSCEPEGWRDSDGDEPQIEIAWYVDAVEVATTATLDGSSFDKGDLVRCLATPNDGTDSGPAVLSPTVEIGNSAPSIDGVKLDSTDPKAIDPLSYTLVGVSDSDGDAITSTAEWFVDGELVASGVDTLPARSFTKGQSVWAVVTPTDGIAVGDPVTSDTATGANTPPALTKVALLPSTLYTDTSVFPDIVVDDVDGDRLSYTVSWAVNGSGVSHTGVTLDGEIWFDKGDTVSVSVEASDGTDSSGVVSSDVLTVENSPPTRPEISFEVGKVPDDVDLICRVDVDSVDADDDSLTTEFTWTRNGSAFTDLSTTENVGDTVLAEHTVDLDDWVCTYTVSDGDVTVSASATVLIRTWAGPRVFTSCGNTGPRGPSLSQCVSAYAGTNLDIDTWDVSGGEQEWVVPVTGTYSITAYGAEGGAGTYAGVGTSGAKVYGEFALTKGETLRILVGQRGTGNTYDSGGGGGSFVHNEDGDIMLIAGGGGASGYLGGSNCGGSATTSSRQPDSYSSTTCSYSGVSPGYGGIDLDYGGSYSTYSFGSGGGGYFTDGRSVPAGWGGKAYVNGAEGGYSGYNYGGFGGGGSGGYWYVPGGYSNPYGGGGGGGYTGGAGGYYSAGGGGSYNAGSNPSATPDAHSGEGVVEIDKI